MPDIELSKEIEQEVIGKLQRYLAEELQVDVGSFEAQFLLDFFAEHAGCYFYNKGLGDALAALDKKLEECGEIVYQLEQVPPVA